MKPTTNFLFTRITGKCLFYGMALSAFFAAASVFGDDQQVLDDLYNEIMRTSVGEQLTIDSGGSKSFPADQLKIGSAADPDAEALRQEIEKMVEEAKTRHSDAVKFMQESK